MIRYELKSQLSGKELKKMEESIQPLIQLITKISNENETIEEIVKELKEKIPYPIATWEKNSEWIKKDYEVQIQITSKDKFIFGFQMMFRTTIIFNLQEIVRDLKLKELLE